ncbi:Spore coat protein A [Rhynchospora pubera]|uniref:Spore coat protein A n=1 Tax=Rhynchospora pubera TaxID=906938 RepID=A0AAV8DQT0_9POAL|nr:Spore coat protein A [Rhynchospora pubera]
MRMKHFVALLYMAMGLVQLRGDSGDNLLDPSFLEMFVDELPQMPKIKGYEINNGVPVAGNLTIGIYDTTWKFHRDLPPTRVFAYGTCKESATVPGPTIEALQGTPTYVTWLNFLPSQHFLPWDPTIPTAIPPSGVPTVTHLHGGVQPPTSDGNSLAWFTASFAYTGPHFSSPVYYYPNFQLPGNLWYHDHALGLTRVNLLSGMIGTYQITSPHLEGPLGLPSGPEYDRHLVIFDRDFRVDGSIYMNSTGNNPDIHPQWQPEFFGKAIIVNGKAWPFLTVTRRKYRFRILNASNARFLHLYLSKAYGLHFTHVGSDTNYLRRPTVSRKFLLAPSEIADVIIDFSLSTTNEVILRNDANYPFPDGDSTDHITGTVMKFIIKPDKVQDPSWIPRTLLELPIPLPYEAAKIRYITMYEYTANADEPTHLFLNAKSFKEPVTETPKEGTSEIWKIINLTEDNHPLHIHLGAFTVLEQRNMSDVEEFKSCMEHVNDAVKCGLEKYLTQEVFAIPKHERGWKNVFKMKPKVVTTILVRFKPLGSEAQYAFDVTAEPGYVYHCHILDHEDNEMMRPMKLVH